MTDDIELLHCPFCGSSDSFVERADLSSSYVFCDKCSARGPTECQESDDEETPGEAAAIKAWNRRAQLGAVPGKVQLAESRGWRIYVAGPMTGIEEFNFPAFNDAAERLRDLGWHVENPADHGVVEGAEWGDYLRYDIGRLATCEKLALLPGWEKSKGARFELQIAEALGMEIIYLDGALTATGGRDVLIRPALQDAAASLECIARSAGRADNLEDFGDVRGYATSRARAAREALAAAQPAQEQKL